MKCACYVSLAYSTYDCAAICYCTHGVDVQAVTSGATGDSLQLSHMQAVWRAREAAMGKRYLLPELCAVTSV